MNSLLQLLKTKTKKRSMQLGSDGGDLASACSSPRVPRGTSSSDSSSEGRDQRAESFGTSSDGDNNAPGHQQS